jgi:VanZ family protein
MFESNPDLRYRSLWLVVGYMLVGLVIFLSVTSEPIDPGIDIPFIDKFFHALAYFTLMFWFAQIYHIKKQRLFYAVALVLMGVLMEYIQSFDPARSYEIADMVANTAGVLIAIVLSRSVLFSNVLGKIERLI